MTTKANRDRANDARVSLSHTAIEANGLDVAIIDQLTNIIHLCAQNDLDFDILADVAFMHFQEETKK